MTHSQILQNPKYKNWVKGGLALKYLQKGLSNFVQQVAITEHQQMMKSARITIGASCGSCKPQSIKLIHKKCPNNICDTMYDEIMKQQASNKVYWNNTDIKKWTIDPWEVAKCYIYAPGYENKHSAAETDAAGLLHLFINNTKFQDHVDCGINFIKKIRSWRNSVLHSPLMELEDQALADGIADIIAFLIDDKELRHDTSSKQSVLNLEKLQTESFIITTENEVDVLKEAQAAIVKTVEELKLKQEREAQTSRQEYQELKLKQEQEAQSSRQEYQNLKLKQEREAQSLKQEYQELKLKQEQEAQSLRQEHQELKLKQEQDSQSSKKEYQKTQSKIIELQQIANILEERLVSIDPREQQQRIDMETKLHKRLVEEIDKHLGNRDRNYVRQRDDLQKALIGFYKENNRTIPVSPVQDDLESNVIDVYVRPLIMAYEPEELIRVHRGIATGTQVTSYKQMLLGDNDRRFKNIYLKAKPGAGKTTFCTHLSAVWCQAHNPDQRIADKFDDDDIQALRQYRLAFFIELRQVHESLCDVDEMVKSFISSRLTVNVSEEWLQKILVEESCLIVLDGLDEWNHPKTCKVERKPRDIPHQKHHANFTVLTTTRSWKLDIIKLKPSEYDRRLDIHELDDTRLTEFGTNVVKVLNRIHGTHKTADDFNLAMRIIDLGEIRHTPYVQLLCLCLWFSDGEIGKSKCQIFANITEATLERHKNRFQSENLNEIDNAGSVPLCFEHNMYCNQHRTLLRTLGKMAFDSTLNKEFQQMLVMDLAFVSKHLTEKELEYCLKLGLLTQNKDYSKIAKRVSNVSFPHKTVHEFYCALYIRSTSTTSSRSGSDVTSSRPGSDVTSSRSGSDVTSSRSGSDVTSSRPGSDVTSSRSGSDVTSSPPERETVQNVIVHVCSDLSKILEISAILIFLSGLDSQQCSQILKTLSTVVTGDSTCKAYRARAELDDDYNEYETMFNFQTLLTDCACEMKLNGEDVQSLPLEDIMINKRSKKAEHVSLLRSILQTSETNIKTLDIQECVDTTEVTHIFDMLDLRSLSSLEKLVLGAVAREQDVQQLLQQSTDTLRTLCLNYKNYEENSRRYTGCRTELSEQCTDTILSMQLLQAVDLAFLLLSHDQWERIVAFITSRTTVTEVALWDIPCRDHRRSCPGFTIDLSRHENLTLLALVNVSMSQLQVNSKSLGYCVIGRLPNSVISSWFQSLPAAQNLYDLRCLSLSEDDTRIMTETIPELLYLTQLHVYDTNLGDRRLSLSRDMTKLKYIVLYNVTLTSESLRDLVDTVSHLAQSVGVRLYGCTVLPEDEYQAIKQEISQSVRYLVVQDGHNEYGQIVFYFRTMTETEVDM